MIIERAIKQNILKNLSTNKVILLLGARRVGKTFFLEQLKKNEISSPVLEFNGEDLSTVEVLKIRTVENYKKLIGDYSIIFIDEAQKVPDIGQILKLMIDNIKGLTIIVTGSSVFDLTNKLGEPLTGRSITYKLHPFSQFEFSAEENLIQTRARIDERLIYGSYPELMKYNSYSEKASYLKELVNSYLLKDILAYDGIRNSSKIISLLRLVAFQLGKEVSMEELGKQLGISRNTVERYLDLLSKVFVIYQLSGFSRNLRKEITKTSKWYFYDNGVRNTLIANLNPLNLRNDLGELWENYLLSERIKYQEHTRMLVNNYFWRTYQQQEIDWVEEREGKLFAYEIKWSPNLRFKIPSAWKDAYPDSEFHLINPENYLDWIMP